MVNRRQLLKLSALGTASFAAPLAYSASKMTMIYKTGNPIGSASSTDLYDNAQSLDFFVNGPNPSYPDRLGVLRKSWMGMEGSSIQIKRAANLSLILIRLRELPCLMTFLKVADSRRR